MCPKCCQPFYAKIRKNIYPYIQSFVNSYSQFIDYLFFLWNGSVVKHHKFLKKLNNRHLTIKFDFKYSKTIIEFSDRAVYKTFYCLLILNHS